MLEAQAFPSAAFNTLSPRTFIGPATVLGSNLGPNITGPLMILLRASWAKFAPTLPEAGQSPHGAPRTQPFFAVKICP